MRRIGFSYAHALALTTSYQVAAIGVHPAEERAEAVPQRGILEHVELEVSAIAGGATTVSVYLAHDAAGDRPASNVVVVTLVVGVTTATAGGGVGDLGEQVYFQPDDGVIGALYLIAKTNAGTCTASFRLHWRA